MIRRACILSVAIAVSMLVLACTATDNADRSAKPRSLTVTVDNSGSTIELARNQQLIVSLSSNRTTGYSWSLADITTGILKLEGPPTYVRDPASPDAVGAGGTETWKFTPTGAGQQSLRFEYRQPWEPNVLPARVVEYTVTVR
ncbi:MAG: protease inhibitor I42 family protein [Firmicutes bacterium]|nr:protease inhibitor I42 family protein [Bacillota bacterium]